MKIKTFKFILFCVVLSILCGVVAARWSRAKQEAMMNLTIREPVPVVCIVGGEART